MAARMARGGYGGRRSRRSAVFGVEARCGTSPRVEAKRKRAGRARGSAHAPKKSARPRITEGFSFAKREVKEFGPRAVLERIVHNVSAVSALDDLAQRALTEADAQRARRKRFQRDYRRQFRVRRFAGPLVHEQQLDHLRIAHVTDIHVGRVTPHQAQLEAVRLVNEGQPDAVMITGDFVCHSTLHLDELVEAVSGYNAPVFCVMGNHDHWSGADEVRWALRHAGAEVLDNRHTTITLRRQPLQVVGLDDAYTGHASWRDATKGLRAELPTIGLSHIAEEADALWSAGVPLVLSGHTHAGQVTIAGLHELAVGKLAGHKYVHGLYGTRRPTQEAEGPRGAVYVGAGVGAAMVPLRLGERGRREVTFFELGQAAASILEPYPEQLALAGRKPSPKTVQRRQLAVAKKRERRERAALRRGSAVARQSASPSRAAPKGSEKAKTPRS